MYRPKSKEKSKLIILLLLLVLAIGGVGYIYNAPEFERTPPTIEHSGMLFWNKKDPIAILLHDNSGLKSYEVTLSDGSYSAVIAQGTLPHTPQKYKVLVRYPTHGGFNPKSTHFTLSIKATDKSLWHFMQGNSSTKAFTVQVDYKHPTVSIVTNSHMINQGGAALVVFYAKDENLKSLYVKANGNHFIPQPYKKEGYYATLIAWPFKDDTFEARVVATDIAGNKTEVHIPLYHKNPHYKTSTIRATDKFIDGKITDLASSHPEYANIQDRLERLKAINETMRQKNEALIHQLSKHVSTERLDSWHIQRFYPLKNAKKVASFGDHRYYYYHDKNHIISESYHLGYDFASTKMADIITSNAGKVVFADENGIYGNMPLIDHGLGLYTLYGHCSQLLVKEGDRVHAGQVIGKTGTTGLALGDHLHFGILVQGIEVRPIEWFDKTWIKKFIDNVFKEADAIISHK